MIGELWWNRLVNSVRFLVYMPPLSLCGDNGAMIACAGSYAFDAGIRADSSLNASATMELTDWGDMGNGQ